MNVIKNNIIITVKFNSSWLEIESLLMIDDSDEFYLLQMEIRVAAENNSTNKMDINFIKSIQYPRYGAK